MTRRSRRFLRVFLAIAVIVSSIGIGASHAVVVTDIFGANVTTVSWTVVWWADEPATGSVEIFLDADGFFELTPFLVLTNLSDGNAAARGLMAIQVAGLAPGTEYFVRTTTIPTGGGAVTVEPATTPLLGIRTSQQAERVADDLSIVANDLLTLGIFESDGTTPAMGGLVVAIVEGATRPIVGFVGNGIAAPLALLDLNNLYTIGPGISLATGGGEGLTLLALGGFTGADQSSSTLPTPTGLWAPISAGPALVLGGLLSDSDADGLSDALDNCPTTANGFRPGQRAPDGGIQVDQDHDGFGDVCDPTPVPEPGLAGALVAGAWLLVMIGRRRATSAHPHRRMGL